MMQPFTWKNCYADVQTCKHDVTMLSYLNDVIIPATETLQQRIIELGDSDEGFAVFAKGDLQEVLRETLLAFGLSLQAI